MFSIAVAANGKNPHNKCASAASEDDRRYEHLDTPQSPPKFSRPARLALTRFGAHHDFQSGTTQLWGFNGRAFEPKGVSKYEQVSSDPEISVLAGQQDFSLGKMVETGYLTAKDARMFRKLGIGLDTRQVDFFEMFHSATDAEVAEYYNGNPGAGRTAGFHIDGERADGMHTIKTAAMWNLAGQVWDRKTGIRSVPLAWQKEDARKGQELDRSKYKYVFEWGRAAQDVPGEAILLYSAITLLNYTQVRAYGGKIEDAYVMFHSFDEKNTRLYLRMFPDSIYPANWTNKSDALFLVPLKVALEKYMPSKASDAVASIVELSGGKINDVQAIDLLLESRAFEWSELDFHTPRVAQSTPIILFDPTYNGSWLLSLRCKQHELTLEESQDVLDYFGQRYSIRHTANYRGKYKNAANSALSAAILRHENAVEVSNLDPKIAKSDSKYVRSVLMSAYKVYLDRAARVLREAHGYTELESFQHAVEYLAESDLKFAVTTSFKSVEKQLKSLKPFKSYPLHRVFASQRLDTKYLGQEPYRHREARIYLFSFSQVQALIAKNPDFFRESGGGLQPGVWQSHYFLSQPDLF